MKNATDQAISIEQFQEENYKLHKQISALEKMQAELSAKLNWFEEHYRLDQHRLYGRSSEKTVYPEQESIFNEAEALSDVKQPINAKRNKVNGKRC